MTDRTGIDSARIRDRRASQKLNVFTRMPAVCAASRSQALKFLRTAGDLSIVEWRTLWDLCDAGPMTIRDLSDIQQTDHSLLSRALPAMRDKGYITTMRNEADKRQTLVRATAAGRAAYEAAAPLMARRRAALRETLSDDEIQTLIGLLGRLEAFLNIPADQILATEETP